MKQPLSKLLNRADIWRSSAPLQRQQGIASGYAALDQALHQGGWPIQAITELLYDPPTNGALQLLLPALRRLCRDGRRLVLIDPPYLPYAPALQAAGVAPQQLLLVRTSTIGDQLWAAEQTMRANIAGGMLCWPVDNLETGQLRKLQLAAHSSHGLSLLLRTTQASRDTSPAALRIVLTNTQRGYRLEILKQRGGWAGQQVEIACPEVLCEEQVPVTGLPVYQPAKIAAPDHPSLPVIESAELDFPLPTAGEQTRLH